MKRTSEVKLMADKTTSPPIEMGTLMETVFAQKCSYVQIQAISGMQLKKTQQYPVSKAGTGDEAK